MALRLGVSGWVVPLVAPAVDLSVLALFLAIRYLALCGTPAVVLRPARRLLLLTSFLTLALNVTEPLLVGAYGRAVFDAVGSILLIDWAEVGPACCRPSADSVPTLQMRRQHHRACLSPAEGATAQRANGRACCSGWRPR
ncbi:hypothetical protein [Streptomyces yerevanensis]|uniref:hypothetical protein n=1 Tax=Streptomyces yerevanensis TaxID=66378 RepID=UPI00068CA3A3|nr:hypothetical protein [Streptomyces yerevanensis]